MSLIARYPLFEDGKDIANRFDAVTPNCTFIVRYVSQRAGIGVNAGRIRA
jgi:hypothetical protein